MSLLVQKDGAEVPYQRTKVAKKRVVVIGATPRIVTRAKITYLEHGDLGATLQPSPIHGRTYILDATAGATAVRVTDERDAAVSPAEESAVRAEERRFGEPETLSMVIARLTFGVDTPVDVPANVAKRLIGGPDAEVTGMQLTFRGREGDLATFSMVVRVTDRRAGSETRSDFAGTVRVDVDNAQILELRLAGPVRTTGSMVAEGTGEIVAVRERLRA